MANYLMKYKGKYRILPSIDEATNDFPRNSEGNIEDNDIYISCQHGCKIFCFGHTNSKKVVWLTAYIPSIGRGRNIIRALNEQGITYEKYKESSEEVMFNFLAKDIEVVADLMKARIGGSDISPFSSRNLPKSNVLIPTEKIELYKKITGVVPKSDLLSIHKETTNFLESVLQKKCKKNDKKFDYKKDQKKMCLGRQTKEYIFVKGFFDEYLDYLSNVFKKYE